MSATDVLAVLGGEGDSPKASAHAADDAMPHELLRVDATLWPQIRELIEDDICNAPRERQRAIGPSELGTDCVPCLAAKLVGWPRKRGTSWLSFIGTCVHEHFERMFADLNPQGFNPDVRHRPYETEMRVMVGELHGLAGGYQVRGSIDLYDRASASTVDWKIVGATTLKDVKAHGPSQTYMVQASLYGIDLRNAGEKVDATASSSFPETASASTTRCRSRCGSATSPDCGRWRGRRCWSPSWT